MKAGVGYREFAEVAKCAFVDVATSDYGLRGRPTNISRVAVMTGLTRKEVKRLREKIAAGREIEVGRIAPYVAILEQWHGDPEFLNASGRPLVLGFDGPSPSFCSLVKKYGGDIPPGAMRTELKRVNAVTEDGNGNLYVQKRVFRPVDVEHQLELALGQAICSLAHTLSRNIDSDIDEGHIQRIAYANNIRAADMGRVRRVSRDRVADFVESVNELFLAYETIYGEEQKETQDENVMTVGIGAYYFELGEDDNKFYVRS